MDPLVTVATLHGGQRITAVNMAAKMQGIKPGLLLADARIQFPNLIVKQANPKADLKALGKLAKACERYSPWTAIDPLGNGKLASMSGSKGIWIDITGCAHLYKGERPLVEDLRDRCIQADYQPRIGLADTPGAAWAAARFSNASFCIIPPQTQRENLSTYPITALRLDPSTLKKLESFGLRHIYDLYGKPRAPILSRFGDKVLKRLDQMLGRIEEPISPRQSATLHYTRMVFAEPIGRTEDVKLVLNKLLKKLCLSFEVKNLGVLQLELLIFRVDNSWARLRIGTSQASRNPDHLELLFRKDLEALNLGFGIEVASLIATETSALNARQIDIEGKISHRPNDNSAKLVDRLSGRLGMKNIVRLQPIKSHLPECATRTLPALETSFSKNNWRNFNRHPQRPIQLLQQPLPIEVIASAPDGPPVMFLWRKQQHRIVSAAGPERISPEWWRPTQLRIHTHPVTQETRDYYRLEDQNGQRFWVFRKGFYRLTRPPIWYLHGFFA